MANEVLIRSTVFLLSRKKSARGRKGSSEETMKNRGRGHRNSFTLHCLWFIPCYFIPFTPCVFLLQQTKENGTREKYLI